MSRRKYWWTAKGMEILNIGKLEWIDRNNYWNWKRNREPPSNKTWDMITNSEGSGASVRILSFYIPFYVPNINKYRYFGKIDHPPKL